MANQTALEAVRTATLITSVHGVEHIDLPSGFTLEAIAKALLVYLRDDPQVHVVWGTANGISLIVRKGDTWSDIVARYMAELQKSAE